MSNFIINNNGNYFYLSIEVAKMLDVTKLQNCETFDTMESFLIGVCKRFPEIDDYNVLAGSYIELWYDDEIDKVVIDHGWIDGEFDVENLAEQISEYKAD